MLLTRHRYVILFKKNDSAFLVFLLILNRYGDGEGKDVERKPHKNVQTRIVRVDDPTLREKLQFFHIELKVTRKRDREITEDEERCEGLGGA